VPEGMQSPGSALERAPWKRLCWEATTGPFHLLALKFRRNFAYVNFTASSSIFRLKSLHFNSGEVTGKIFHFYHRVPKDLKGLLKRLIFLNTKKQFCFCSGPDL
jgi:hypothetical protein